MSFDRKKTQTGWALPAVLFAAIIVALALGTILTQSNRQVQSGIERKGHGKFKELQRVLKNIFEIPQLCTCNLRDLEIGKFNENLTVTLDAHSTDVRRKFGYYQLGPQSTCANAINQITGDQIVLQITNSNGNLENSANVFRAEYLKLQSFKSQPANGNYARYSANLVFAVAPSADHLSEIARSNIRDPIDLTVYLETENINGKILIRKCYQSKAMTPPSPLPNTPPISPSNLSCYIAQAGIWGKFGCDSALIGHYQTLSECDQQLKIAEVAECAGLSTPCQQVTSPECDPNYVPPLPVCTLGYASIYDRWGTGKCLEAKGAFPDLVNCESTFSGLSWANPECKTQKWSCGYVFPDFPWVDECKTPFSLPPVAPKPVLPPAAPPATPPMPKD